MKRRNTVQLVISGVVLALLVGWFVWTNVVHPGSSGTASAAASKTAGASTSAKPTASKSNASASSKASIDPVSKLRWVTLGELPTQASDTMKEIVAGPPYAYPSNDGVVYHNNNDVLPKQTDGYYREFTVVTPGSSTRGARRIIAGGPNRGQTNAEFYYTGDHYDSFVRIRP